MTAANTSIDRDGVDSGLSDGSIGCSGHTVESHECTEVIANHVLFILLLEASACNGGNCKLISDDYPLEGKYFVVLLVRTGVELIHIFDGGVVHE